MANNNNAFVFFGPNHSDRLFLTCEHASQVLPSPWPTWDEADRWIVGTHWSVDIGAETLARELAEAFGCQGIAACFSRLLCDANRPLDSETLFRPIAEGKSLVLNQNISPEERTLRLETLYHPYHNAIDKHLREHKSELLFSIHSFTDNYEGQKRAVEVGVLFNEHEDLAVKMNTALVQAGFESRLNEPWSGRAGFMNSVDWHSKDHGVKALMIEARQDLIVQPEWRAKLVQHLVEILKSFP